MAPRGRTTRPSWEGRARRSALDRLLLLLAHRMARLARGVSLLHRDPHLLDADLGALSRGDAEVEQRGALLAVGAAEQVLHAPRELLDLRLDVLLLADGRPPDGGRGVH